MLSKTGGDNGANAATASPARKALKKASSDIKKVVSKVSDSMKTALSGKDNDNTGHGGEGAAG